MIASKDPTEKLNIASGFDVGRQQLKVLAKKLLEIVISEDLTETY